jgi:polar amino acid transport system ATP-binding protein
VLKGIDLAVAQGELVFIIGPSGSGKSTLLRCCNRLEEPSSGLVMVDGIDITRHDVDINRVRQKIGMVFQSFNLYPHMNALGNVTLALQRVQNKSKIESNEIGMRALTRVGLAEKAMAYPNELSGAWRSRARSPWSRASCCSTSRPARSTRSWSAACSR